MLQRDPSANRPTTVVLRYSASPESLGFVPGVPSIDGAPALPASVDGPYAEIAFSSSPEEKTAVEFLHADEELRGNLRLIRLNFVGVLESLGAITRERALEIVSEPLVEPR